jgi:hypothetical protein
LSFVEWWSMSVDDMTRHELEYHYDDDDNNDCETTTINRK